MFDKILVATDSPTDIDGATFTAAELAAQDGCPLCILHVLESSYSGKYRQYVKHFATGEEIVAGKSYEEEVRRTMEQTVTDLIPPLESYSIEIRQGIPWEQILKCARKQKTNLIVLGAHTKRAQQEGFARLTKEIGSTVEEVILRERCPVMIVNEPARRGQLRFERILVPVDFSKACEYALQFAADLAGKSGGRLFVFHMTSNVGSQQEKDENRQALTSTLRLFAEEMTKGIACDFVIREGNLPYLEILKYGAEKGVDLIVMGSHTRKIDVRPYLGSAVVQVSCQSLRPVVVVNASKALAATKGMTSSDHSPKKSDRPEHPYQAL